ncbi:MAG: response regulator [Armatimonadetes bacterium]|nr:response regulator [Armatimonadota bacterium]
MERTVFRFLLGTACAGLPLAAAAAHAAGGSPATAGLWAAAFLVAGALTGFLFGVPKVDPAVAPSDPAPARPRLRVNTNLEQFSDWLTKTIVGLGLVEVRRLDDYFDRIVTSLAPGFGGAGAGGGVLAGAVVVLFFTLGFLLGYLETRLFLGEEFRKSDERTAGLLDQVAKMSADVAHVSRTVTSVIAETPQAPLDPPPAEDAARWRPVRAVLWVGDRPEANRLLVDALGQRGVAVEQAATTAEALDKLARRTYERLLSDMGRTEDGVYQRAAGVELARRVREAGLDLPLLVYCAEDTSADLQAAALAGGADEVVTANAPLKLIGRLRLDGVAQELTVSEDDEPA